MTAKGAFFSTRQKREVQAVIDGLDGPFTVQHIRAKIEASGARVSRASIYRYIQSLCLAGQVQQIPLPDGRRIFARPAKDAALCIIECADCGKLSACAAPTFDRCSHREAALRGLSPLQTVVYLRAACKSRRCESLPA